MAVKECTEQTLKNSIILLAREKIFYVGQSRITKAQTDNILTMSQRAGVLSFLHRLISMGLRALYARFMLISIPENLSLVKAKEALLKLLAKR
ncbi:MAG: hypothetical protein QXL91_01190 [Candidatus Bathyarchaeia archaeon]|nr:hypothetical protein [Candidatus Bathyarchaeota archaeon]